MLSLCPSKSAGFAALLQCLLAAWARPLTIAISAFLSSTKACETTLSHRSSVTARSARANSVSMYRSSLHR